MLHFVARTWYYFRLGYGTYLTFLLGYVSTLVTVYYLAIRNIPYLLDLFPKFEPFAVLATAIGTPVAVVFGWVHLKRSQLAASEQHISVEMNPYTYILPASGIARDVLYPSTLLQLQIIRKLGEREGVLTPKEKQLFEDYESKFTTLLNGDYVGVPRTSSLRKPNREK